MRLPVRILLALCLLGLGGTGASAQRIVGQVVDQETGSPISTAFLILLDHAGTRTGGTQQRPDVRGVLWLDARTAELRYLDYQYTRHLHLPGISPKPFGGRTEFRQLENGYWIAERWWIRMPEFQVAPVRPEGPERTRLVVREVGAEVVDVVARAPGSEAAGETDPGITQPPEPHP
jgi:hypothetical protein